MSLDEPSSSLESPNRKLTVNLPVESRRLAPVFWSGFFTFTQSLSLIGLESAEGYPLTVNDIPQAREIPKTPHIMMYLWVQCLLPGVGTRHPLRWGKETHPPKFLSL
ncbi:hypothetical protein TNCV_3315511 [Trichonephila clavipes]|nr:hypothetical protein TNCV_3315511 [Trichonephila clavipes]